MKIYLINKIPNNFINKTNLQFKSQKYNELYSMNDGQYIVNATNCWRIEPSFDAKYEIIENYNGINLLIDSTNIKKINVLSQLPTEYVCNKITEYSYFTGSKASLKLIIKYLDQPNDLKPNDLKPNDLYLEYNGEKFDLDNVFLKEELNMFLSLLN